MGSLLLASVLTAGAGVSARETKPRSVRKVLDLTPPQPNEMLANPSRGSGSPPRLSEFAPTAAMHLAQDKTEAPAAETHALQEAADDDAKSGRASAAGPPVQASNMQMQVTEQIAKLGVEGFLAQRPQGANQQEQQSWESVRREIAASLATWRAQYGSSPEQMPQGAATPSPVGANDKPEH